MMRDDTRLSMRRDPTQDDALLSMIRDAMLSMSCGAVLPIRSRGAKLPYEAMLSTLCDAMISVRYNATYLC